MFLVLKSVGEKKVSTQEMYICIYILSSSAPEAATACFLNFEAKIKKKEHVWILI